MKVQISFRLILTGILLITCSAATNKPADLSLPTLETFRITIVNNMVIHTKTGASQRQLDAFTEVATATNKILSVPEVVDICLFDWLRAERLAQIVKAAGDSCTIEGEDNQSVVIDKIMTCAPVDPSRPIETVMLKGVQSKTVITMLYTTTGGRENVGLQKMIRGERIGPCA